MSGQFKSDLNSRTKIFFVMVYVAKSWWLTKARKKAKKREIEVYATTFMVLKARLGGCLVGVWVFQRV